MTGSKDIILGYTKITFDTGGIIYMPIIDVELQKTVGGRINTFRTKALIDSGSMYNIFRADTAEALGIKDIKSGEYLEIGGIAPDNSGKKSQMIRCWKHIIGLNIKGRVRKTEAYFTPDLSPNAFQMLGQVGFFDRFQSVKLDYRRAKVVIK